MKTSCTSNASPHLCLAQPPCPFGDPPGTDPKKAVLRLQSSKEPFKRNESFARLLGNKEHVIQRDGSHDPRTCKECVELDLLLQRLPETRPETELEFDCKYSFVKWHKALGKGAGGVVKLAEVVSRKSIPTSTPDPASNPASIPDSVLSPDTGLFSTSKSSPKLVAVKEFRKRRKDESLEDYISRLTDEYRIATSLHHNNIVETIDIVRHHRRWYEVMEYCSEGDMFRLLQKKSLTEYEVNCCFRQLVEAVWFLHSHGIAHRDLKLENMLLDSHGTLKISDFGVSQVFRANKFDYFHKARGVCGSLPYIAPEEYTQEEYDARAVDVWSLGIIYFALSFNSVPWKTADATDRNFRRYLNDGQVAIEPFARLPPDRSACWLTSSNQTR